MDDSVGEQLVGEQLVGESGEQSELEGHHVFTVDVENQIVIARLRGPVTLESLLDLAERVYADDRCHPDFDTIVEIQTTQLAMDFEGMHEYSERISANPKMLRGRLVLVASTAVAYGIGRMYQGTHDSFPGEVHFEPTVEAAMLALRPANR